MYPPGGGRYGVRTEGDPVVRQLGAELVGDDLADRVLQTRLVATAEGERVRVRARAQLPGRVLRHAVHGCRKDAGEKQSRGEWLTGRTASFKIDTHGKYASPRDAHGWTLRHDVWMRVERGPGFSPAPSIDGVQAL